jgi:signal peptidase I
LLLKFYKIRGHSLHPDFKDGDYVLAAGFPFPFNKIRVGDVIVFHQPGLGTLIKRVQTVLNGGSAFDVRGTQINSTDSRDYGPIPRETVRGKIIWHIRKP